MEKKQTIYKIKGMSRDLNNMSFDKEHSFENKNIRITADKDNGLLSITNEKGTKTIDSDLINSVSSILGHAVINDYLILFCKQEEEQDCILKVQFTEDNAIINNIYSGNLNFSTEHPIETLVDIENENIQKVYWVDGLNPLRVINISKEYISESEDPFAFVLPIKTNHIFSVEKGEPVGQFPAGVIQYAFTYFNKFGQESAVVDVSPIYYIAHDDRGASPEDIVSTSFNLTFSNLDSNWEYIRIYSIIRTSLNTTPEIKKIVDLSLIENIEYIDTNTYGENIAPTDLLYKGGEVLSASTIAQKDSTLFLGNINVTSNIVLDDSIKNFIKNKLNINKSHKVVTIGPKPLYDNEYNSEELTGNFYDYLNNLNKSNREITTFKRGETYRIGVQLQDKYGKWSDPVFIEDIESTIAPTEDTTYKNSTTVKLPTFKSSIAASDAVQLNDDGYIAIRPLIVYPQESERTCVAQGILCPTVYNVEDRLNNSPFSQSSWFLRPNIITDLTSYEGKNIVCSDSNHNVTNMLSSGKWAEFRHNLSIQADTLFGNGEIADFGYTLTSGKYYDDVRIYPYIEDGGSSLSISGAIISGFQLTPVTLEDFKNKFKNNFFVDRNILTFHSPDINDYSKLDDLKLRIVGYVPITASTSSIELETSTSEILDKASLRNVNGVIKNYNKSYRAGRHLVNGNFWYDYLYSDRFASGFTKYTTVYPIFPWNRSTGLSFTTSNNPTMLNKSRYSIFQFSNNSIYFDYKDNTIENCEIKLVNYNSPLVKFSDGTTYLGDYNKIISTNDAPEAYSFTARLSIGDDVAESAPIYTDFINEIRKNQYSQYSEKEFKDIVSYGLYKPDEGLSRYSTYGTRDKISLIPITYKSSTHGVVKLPDNKYLCDSGEATTNDIYKKPFWENGNSINISKITVDDFNSENFGVKYDYLFLAELYRDIDHNIKFGGTSDYAIQNNLWLPAGKTVDLTVKGVKEIVWSEGDTYYQRYDHIKTKPYDDTSLNGMTVIASFMCETRTNLDGRYDRNRKQDDYFNVTDENYNLINNVYSQQNNYFNYRVLDSERFNITKFPNSIVWSKTKLPNNIIDPWLNINLASTLDLDGNKGNITSLKRFNNEIIAFQDKAVTQVLYNTRTQISATDGVPIEIANSGKVDGKRYISDNIGCLNKWSICESPNGIYFIDDYNKSINIFNSQGIQSLSEMKGFHSWINNKSSVTKWNPNDFTNAITYRDPINNEILFVYEDTCLIYNELLNEFTSFYDYGKSYPFVNLNGRNIIFNDNIIYGYQEGDYNNIFGENKEYYIDIIANENPLNDKIFTNIEFRADTYNEDESKILDNKIDFNTLSARNEYQHSLSKLSYSQNRPSNLKKKFRIWRADIPRDGKNRIRNTWTHIKLSSDATTNRKTRLHDLSVIYYV